MKTDELETMMGMLLEGGDMVSVLDPVPDDLPGAKPSTKKKADCTDAKEECCELV